MSKVIHCQTAQQIWSCLRGIYENRTSFALTDLIGRMNSYRMHTLEEVESGVSEIQAMACQIRALGGTADDATVESAILRALPKSFSGFVTSWTFLDSEKRSLDNLHAHLVRTVHQLKIEDTSSKNRSLLATFRKYTKPVNEPLKPSNKDRKNDQKIEQSSKKKFCRYCKSTDHVISECKKLA